MNVRSFLYHVRRDSKRLYVLIERAEYLRATCLPNALPYKKSPVQTSAPQDKTSEALSKLIDLEASISDQIIRTKRHRATAEALIRRLSSAKQRQALQLYFLELRRDGALMRPLTFDEACGEMGLSPESFKTHRKKGIRALQKMIENAPNV